MPQLRGGRTGRFRAEPRRRGALRRRRGRAAREGRESRRHGVAERGARRRGGDAHGRRGPRDDARVHGLAPVRRRRRQGRRGRARHAGQVRLQGALHARALRGGSGLGETAVGPGALGGLLGRARQGSGEGRLRSRPAPRRSPLGSDRRRRGAGRRVVRPRRDCAPSRGCEECARKARREGRRAQADRPRRRGRPAPRAPVRLEDPAARRERSRLVIGV